MPTEQFAALHTPEQFRYVLQDQHADPNAPAMIGEAAYVDIPGDFPERVFFHTEVSPEHSGQGLASLLVRTAVEDSISAGYKIVPVCPYIKAWLPKHPEFADHVVAPRADHLRAIRDQQSTS